MASCLKAGDVLLSRWTHYHRPRVLIGRVRDGNGSGHPGMVAGSSLPLSGARLRGQCPRRFRAVVYGVSLINGGCASRMLSPVRLHPVPRFGRGKGRCGQAVGC